MPLPSDFKNVEIYWQDPASTSSNIGLDTIITPQKRYNEGRVVNEDDKTIMISCGFHLNDDDTIDLKDHTLIIFKALIDHIRYIPEERSA